jgi:hypothetical protein
MLPVILVARVAVIVGDPTGHADQVSQAVVQRLRLDGLDAVAVDVPREVIDQPGPQDERAKEVGASHVLALDLQTERHRGMTGGELVKSYPPMARVFGQGVMLISPESMHYPVIEDLAPQFPPPDVQHPRFVQEEVRAKARMMWRTVGEKEFTIDRQLIAGAMTGWREDTPGRESRTALEHQARLWQGLGTQLGGDAAEAIKMK